jgi:hypothetical protein
MLGNVLWRIVIVGAISFSGTCLPLTTFSSFGRLINLFWESIYGLGLLVIALLPGGLDSRVGLLIGALLWPLLVAIGLFFLIGAVARVDSPKVHMILVVLIIVSLFCVVPFGRTSAGPLSYLPLYSHFVFSVY